MNATPDTESSPQSNSSTASGWKMGASGIIKIIVLLGVAALFGYLYFNYRHELELDSLAGREATLQQFRLDHPVAVYALAFLIYVIVIGLSIPGGAVLTLCYGWFFGFWPALILVSFASTTGATVAFLLSRYLFRDVVQKRFGSYLTKFNDALQKEGAFYLLTLRLIPAVPFWLINLVLGLTPIHVTTYWWVSQLGMLAGTCVFIYAGHSVPTFAELAEKGTSGILSPQLIVAFLVLALFPLIVKQIMVRFQRAPESGAR